MLVCKLKDKDNCYVLLLDKSVYVCMQSQCDVTVSRAVLVYAIQHRMKFLVNKAESPLPVTQVCSKTEILNTNSAIQQGVKHILGSLHLCSATSSHLVWNGNGTRMGRGSSLSPYRWPPAWTRFSMWALRCKRGLTGAKINPQKRNLASSWLSTHTVHKACSWCVGWRGTCGFYFSITLLYIWTMTMLHCSWNLHHHFWITATDKWRGADVSSTVKANYYNLVHLLKMPQGNVLH